MLYTMQEIACLKCDSCIREWAQVGRCWAMGGVLLRMDWGALLLLCDEFSLKLKFRMRSGLALSVAPHSLILPLCDKAQPSHSLP